MQKDTRWVGIALLGAAMLLMAWQAMDQSARMKAFQSEQAKIMASQAPVAGNQKSSTAAIVAEETLQANPVPGSSPEVKPVHRPEKESLVTLENSFLKVIFTSRGGAIRSVALKDFPAIQGMKDPYVLQAPGDLPFLALNFTDRPDGSDLNNYRLISETRDGVTFARTVASGVILERHYTLTAPAKERNAEGYLINQTLAWHNVSTNDLQLPAFSMNVGTALPSESDPQNMFLDFGSYDGKKANFIHTAYFKGGGFLFWSQAPRDSYELKTPIDWAAVDNKFFSILCMPKSGAVGVSSRPVMTDGVPPKEAITGSLQFSGPLVMAGGTVMTESQSYFGPKEYARLASLPDHQDEVMQWGWPIFSFFSKLFISMLNWIAGAVHNYGVAIIILTLIIRGVLWPFSSAAANSAKKMAVVQPLLKEIQAKYKNDQARLQKETVRIFQENQVNPLAGCLPALFQIPVFFGFYSMLRTSAELRFEPFLWIRDLSMPDTVAHIGGFPINPLPVIMCLSWFMQMKLTPSGGDPEQQKVMQLMPFIFLVLLYNFSAGLALYITLSNIISIIQQLIINKPTLPPGNGNVIDVKATVVK